MKGSGRWIFVVQALALAPSAGCGTGAALAQTTPPRRSGASATAANCQSVDPSGRACADVGATCQGQRSDCAGGAPPGVPPRCSQTQWRCECEAQDAGGASWRCEHMMHPAGPQQPPELSA